MSNNLVKIKGHLGQPPRTVDGEKGKFTAFSVAISNDYMDKKTKEWVKKPPTWAECIAFSPGVCALLGGMVTGDRLEVEGRLTSRKREADGKLISELKINATSVESLFPYGKRLDKVPYLQPANTQKSYEAST